MYYYIAEPASNKKDQLAVNTLRAKLAPAGIAGEFVYRTPGQSASNLASKAIALGFNTIIAVGKEDLFNEVASAMYDQPVALGLVPIDESKSMEEIIGYSTIADSIQVIKRRKLVLKDVGTINNEFCFIKESLIKNSTNGDIYLHTSNFSAQINSKFLNLVLPTNSPPLDIPGVINFIIPNNIGSPLWMKSLFSVAKLNIDTIIRSETAVVQSKNDCDIYIADVKIASTPFTVNIVPQSLRLIVAKHE
jgi:hypothetical protein